MSHLDSKTLANYNSLIDPNLRSYFSTERIRSHLKHAGLVNRRGEIISDSEYRSRLARREHKKHVRQVLAENIVHRAIDMERARQAELRRQLDMITKAALVNNVKESRRRGGGYLSPSVPRSDDMGLLSIHSSWSQTRSKSTNQHRDIELMNDEFDGQPRILRVQSAHVNNDHHRKHLSKSPTPHRRYLNRPKSSSAPPSSSLQPYRSPKKPPSDSSCRIIMVYFGPHTKPVYDHSIFEPIDEIMVMQQHCGGENLIVYKANHKPEDQFTFNSRRHSDYPLGLSLYVNGLIDSRISTCCEYKHRHGVRLGGERGHFAVVSVDGSKPCLKCRFEKQIRLKKDVNQIEDEGKKPITISIPVSKQPRTKQAPVKIPVRHPSESDEHYSEDFDGSDKVEKSENGHSSNSDGKKITTRESSAKDRPTAAIRSKSPTESNSTLTTESNGKSSKKTWQVIFHSSNIPTGSFQLPNKSSIDVFLKFAFISTNGNDETEQYKIDMREFPQCFKSGRQDSFRAKLKNIGKPKQIRLILETTEDKNVDIKWHLDYVEVIDPESQSRYKFSCNQWIRPSQVKILNRTESSQYKMTRKSSTTTTSSEASSTRKKPSQQPTTTSSEASSTRKKPFQQPTTTNKQKAKISSPSSSSLSDDDESLKRFESNKKAVINETQQISTDEENNKTHYRVIIYPSKDHDGEFHAVNDSRIFIRLNNQTKDSFIQTKDTNSCPSFESDENQAFEMDLIQDTNEQPTKLTIGYYNSNITAGKWKLQKIVLINTETGEETVFPCKESLIRNDFNLRAEKTFQAQSKQSDDEEQSTPRNVEVLKPVLSRSESEESTQQQQQQVQSILNNENRSSSSESLQQAKIITEKNDAKSPSIHSSQDSNDEDNEYNRMFKTKDSTNTRELDSSSSRPKTRRGRQDSLEKDSEQEDPSNKPKPNSDIWRPSSELDRKELVDPLVGLDDLQDQTATSNDQTKRDSPQSTTHNPYENWYPENNVN